MLARLGLELPCHPGTGRVPAVEPVAGALGGDWRPARGDALVSPVADVLGWTGPGWRRAPRLFALAALPLLLPVRCAAFTPRKVSLAALVVADVYLEEPVLLEVSGEQLVLLLARRVHHVLLPVNLRAGLLNVAAPPLALQLLARPVARFLRLLALLVGHHAPLATARAQDPVVPLLFGGHKLEPVEEALKLRARHEGAVDRHVELAVLGEDVVEARVNVLAFVFGHAEHDDTETDGRAFVVLELDAALAQQHPGVGGQPLEVGCVCGVSADQDDARNAVVLDLVDRPIDEAPLHLRLELGVQHDVVPRPGV